MNDRELAARLERDYGGAEPEPVPAAAVTPLRAVEDAIGEELPTAENVIAAHDDAVRTQTDLANAAAFAAAFGCGAWRVNVRPAAF